MKLFPLFGMCRFGKDMTGGSTDDFVVAFNSFKPLALWALPLKLRGDCALIIHSRTFHQGDISPFEKGEYPDRGEGLEQMRKSQHDNALSYPKQIKIN